MFYANTSQGVYFKVGDTAPNRTTTFEFYASRYSYPNDYFHFQILFYENLPGIVKYIYFEASNGGSTATIGVQGRFIFK